MHRIRGTNSFGVPIFFVSVTAPSMRLRGRAEKTHGRDPVFQAPKPVFLWDTSVGINSKVRHQLTFKSSIDHWRLLKLSSQ